MDVVDSKVAWLQYMGYYQAGSRHAMAISRAMATRARRARRQASQTRLRMFDIEEMGPNMAMDQLVPGPRESVSAGCFFFAQKTK